GVALPEAFDLLADGLHDAGALVAEHHRPRTLPLALHHVQVGAADADRDNADEHLVRPGLAQVDLAHLERPAGGVEESRIRLHAIAAITASQFVTVETFWSA